jgi:hypothetical protein
MAYTPPPTVTGADVLTAAMWNTYIRDNFEAIGLPLSVKVSVAAYTSIGSSSGYLKFDTENWDTGNFWNPAPINDRFFFPQVGYYDLSATFRVTTSSSGAYFNAYPEIYDPAAPAFPVFGLQLPEYYATATGTNYGASINGIIRITDASYYMKIRMASNVTIAGIEAASQLAMSLVGQ